MCANLDSDGLGFASWRVAFAVEGCMMAPVALLCLLLTNTLSGKPAGRCGDGEGEEDGETLMQQVRAIVYNKIWLCAVLGYGAFTFSVGAVAVWGPYYVQKTFDVPLDEADLYFGAVAVTTGLCGTAAGGALMDMVTRKMGGDIMSSSLLVTVLLTMGGSLCLFIHREGATPSCFASHAPSHFCSFPRTLTVHGAIRKPVAYALISFEVASLVPCSPRRRLPPQLHGPSV